MVGLRTKQKLLILKNQGASLFCQTHTNLIFQDRLYGLHGLAQSLAISSAAALIEQVSKVAEGEDVFQAPSKVAGLQQ